MNGVGERGGRKKVMVAYGGCCVFVMDEMREVDEGRMNLDFADWHVAVMDDTSECFVVSAWSRAIPI